MEGWQESFAKEEVERERQTLDGFCVGPLWTSLAISGDMTLPIFGIKSTKQTQALLAQCDVEHNLENGWAIIVQEGPPVAYLDVEFFSPVQCHISLKFEIKDKPLLSIIANNGGTIALASSKEKYKQGEAIVIEDLATDVPLIFQTL